MSKSIIIALFISSISFSAVASDETSTKSASETNARIVNDAATESIESGSIAKISVKPITLFNYVLNKKMVINNPYELSAMDAGQFIPQIDEFLQLYAEHIANNVRPIEAIMLVHTSDMAMDFIKKASDVANKK